MVDVNPAFENEIQTHLSSFLEAVDGVLAAELVTWKVLTSEPPCFYGREETQDSLDKI